MRDFQHGGAFKLCRMGPRLEKKISNDLEKVFRDKKKRGFFFLLQASFQSFDTLENMAIPHRQMMIVFLSMLYGWGYREGMTRKRIFFPPTPEKKIKSRTLAFKVGFTLHDVFEIEKKKFFFMLCHKTEAQILPEKKRFLGIIAPGGANKKPPQ